MRVHVFSRQVMSDSLWPHGLRHTRPACPSPSPGVCPCLYPLNQWCHPTISSTVALLSFCPQSFPVSGPFPVSWLFESGGQSIEASVSVLPMSWFPLGLTGLISLLFKELSESSPAPQFKSISYSRLSAFFMVMSSANIFSCTVGCLFILPMVFFAVWKPFNWVPFVYFEKALWESELCLVKTLKKCRLGDSLLVCGVDRASSPLLLRTWSQTFSNFITWKLIWNVESQTPPCAC